MKATREEFAEGLVMLGSVGWLVAAFVVPSQLLAGQVRTEAAVGMVASTACLLLAAVVDRTPYPRLLLGPLGVVASVSFVYALAILDAGSGKAVAMSPSTLRLIVVALLVAAGAAIVAIVKLRRVQSRLVPPNKLLERSRDG